MKTIKNTLQSSKTVFILICVMVVILPLFMRIFSRNWNPITSDGFGYYLYLPQVFKYQDLKGTQTWDYLTEDESGAAQGRLIQIENGNFLNKYPIGTALLMAPFYFIIDLANNLIGQDDYFKGIYSISITIAAIFYFIIGLYFLRKTLLKLFGEKVVSIVLVLVSFGTNLIHYASYESSFSHIFSFAIFSIFLFYILEFKKYIKKLLYWFFLGLLFGFAITIRQTNLIVGLLFLIPFVQVYQTEGIIKFIRREYLKLFILILGAFIVFLPQMVYWKIVTDQFLYFSYIGETFNFLQPEFLNVLFSTRKGLFFWTPLLLIVIPGFILMFKKKRVEGSILLAILFLQFYVVSSWWAWSYGYSFGHRAFTEYLVFFSLPIGFFIDWVLRQKSKWFLVVIGIVISLLTFINLFQMQQYWRGLLTPDGVTWEEYQKIFMQPCIGAIEQLRCDWL